MNRAACASTTRKRCSSKSPMATGKRRASTVGASRPDAPTVGDRHSTARRDMARFLHGKGMPTLARSVAMCRPMSLGFRCNKPMLCDSCWVADSYRTQASVVGRVFMALAGNPNLLFVHATLGAGTFRTWQEGVDAIRQTLVRLRRRGPTSWKRLKGGCWVIEIERRESGAYAPHLHAILAFDATNPPKSFKRVGFDWARMMRKVRRPNSPQHPAGKADALLTELMLSQYVECLHAYGSHEGSRLPEQTEDFVDVLDHVWRVVGYARKSKRVSLGGTSNETRHLSMTSRLEIHEAIVRRRDSFGELRAGPGFGIDLEKLGGLLARSLKLGPHTRAVSESGLVPLATPPPREVIEYLRDVASSRHPSLCAIARSALRVSRRLACVRSKPQHLRQKEMRVRTLRGRSAERSEIVRAKPSPR